MSDYKAGQVVVVTEEAVEWDGYPKEYLGAYTIDRVSQDGVVHFQEHMWVCYHMHIRRATKLEQALK